MEKYKLTFNFIAWVLFATLYLLTGSLSMCIGMWAFVILFSINSQKHNTIINLTLKLDDKGNVKSCDAEEV